MSYSLGDTDNLLKALSQNDQEAFKFIYLSYYDGLCAYALNFISNQDEGEDIVQDVLINLWEKRNELEIHTSLKAYLFRSIYNKFLDVYKAKKRKDSILETIRFSTLQAIADNDDHTFPFSENQIDALKNAIDELPEKCKQIFMLSKLQGMKYQEIADLLGVSTKTVENQIGIAFKKLRTKLRLDKNESISLFLLVKVCAKKILIK